MKKTNPRISIITVTYNAGKFLSDCIESVTRQAYTGIEHIIIDGGSTDHTLDIIKENSRHIAFWKSEPDNGIYDAMNKAIPYAKGDWLYFLGADDTLLPGFSEMAKSLNDPDTIYYGKAICNNNIIGRDSYDGYEIASLNICHQTIFYPKAVFRKYQYDTKYPVRADHYLNILCFADKDLKFKFQPATVAVYNPEGFSSQNSDPAFYNDIDAIIRENLGIWTAIRYKLRQIRHKIKGRR